MPTNRGTWAQGASGYGGWYGSHSERTDGIPLAPVGERSRGLPATLTVTEHGALEADRVWSERVAKRAVAGLNRMYASGFGESLRRVVVAHGAAEATEPPEAPPGEAAQDSEDEQANQPAQAAPVTVRVDRADPFGLYAAGVRPVYAGASGERPKESGTIGKRRLKTGARLAGEAEGAAMHVQGPRGGR